MPEQAHAGINGSMPIMEDCIMEIRLATIEDIEALCPLLTEFFAYNAALQPAYCHADVENGEYPREIIESGTADFLIACDADAVVGFIHIDEKKTAPYGAIVQYNYAEIIAFMVTASHRCQGIGSKLIEAAKQWSITRNLDYIELFSLTNATEANDFYDNNSFITVSHNRRYTLMGGTSQ
jgi:GNAT superfamily N-acetyltransferase